MYFIKFYYLMAFISFELIQLVWFSCWEQSNVVTIWLCHKMWFVRVDLQASACKGFLKIPKLIYFYHPYVKFKWLASNFSLQYHPWMTLQGHKNKGNDHQLKKLLIAQQLLLVSTLGNVQRTVQRIYILMSGCKGFGVLCLKCSLIITW